MPRIIVTTDPSLPKSNVSVLMDERVHSVHLSGSHAAAQLIERLAWAISDAEDAESAPVSVERRAQRSSATRRTRARSSARQAVNA